MNRRISKRLSGATICKKWFITTICKKKVWGTYFQFFCKKKLAASGYPHLRTVRTNICSTYLQYSLGSIFWYAHIQIFVVLNFSQMSHFGSVIYFFELHRDIICLIYGQKSLPYAHKHPLWMDVDFLLCKYHWLISQIQLPPYQGHLLFSLVQQSSQIQSRHQLQSSAA